MTATMALLLAVAVQAAGATPQGVTIGRVEGEVRDARTGLGLPGVDIRAGLVTTATDAAGTYVLALPAGAHELSFSLIGYALERRRAIVPPAGTITVSVVLATGAGRFDDRVTVAATAVEAAEAGVPSQTTLDAGELAALRGVLIDDAFRALQVAPGIVTGDDFRAEFSVRGLGPRFLTTTIDGVDVPHLTHRVGGLDDTGSVSMINTDVLQRAVITAGGSHLSAVTRLGATVDFVTRDAEPAPSLRASVGPTSSTLTAAGPLAERGAWLVSGRRSYLGWLLAAIDPEEQHAFGFADGFARVRWRVTDGQTVRGWVLAGRAVFRDPRADDERDKARAVATQTVGHGEWSYAPADGLTVWQHLSVTRADDRNTTPGDRTLESASRRGTSWRTGLRWAGPFGSLDAGVDARRDEASLLGVEPGAQDATARYQGAADDTVAGGWLHARVPLSPALVIAPGGRIERSRAGRIRAASAWTHLESAAGPARVRVSLARRTQLPSADELALWSGPRRPAHATVLDASVDVALARGWTVTTGTFLRRQHDLPIARLGEPRVLEGVVVRGSTYRWESALDGRAAGVEVRAARTAVTGLGGWVGYAWLRATGEDRVRSERFASDWSQAHTVNAAASWRLSPRTSLGMRWRLGSGTPIPGYFDAVGSDFYLGAARNGVRLPAYSRVDVRLDRAWRWGPGRVVAFVEIMNVLNRRNVGHSDGVVDVRAGRVRGLTAPLFPLLPTAGIVLELR